MVLFTTLAMHFTKSSCTRKIQFFGIANFIRVTKLYPSTYDNTDDKRSVAMVIEATSVYNLTYKAVRTIYKLSQPTIGVQKKHTSAVKKNIS